MGPWSFQWGIVTIVVDRTDLIGIAVILIIAVLVLLYLRLHRVRALQKQNGLPSNTGSSTKELVIVEKNDPKPLRYGSGETTGGSWDATGPGYLPDPDPLVDFDLEHASLRDYVYVNKVLRYPYFQVGSSLRFRPCIMTH